MYTELVVLMYLAGAAVTCRMHVCHRDECTLMPCWILRILTCCCGLASAGKWRAGQLRFAAPVYQTPARKIAWRAGLCNIDGVFGSIQIILTAAFAVDILVNFNVAVWDPKRKRAHHSRKAIAKRYVFGMPVRSSTQFRKFAQCPRICGISSKLKPDSHACWVACHLSKRHRWLTMSCHRVTTPPLMT